MSDDSRIPPDTTEVRDAKGRFTAGNPGRRRGARNMFTRAVEALLGREVVAMTEEAIALVKAADVTTCPLCLDRLLHHSHVRSIAGRLGAPGAVRLTGARAGNRWLRRYSPRRRHRFEYDR